MIFTLFQVSQISVNPNAKLDNAIIVISYIVISLLVGIIANYKNRSFVGWLFLSLLFTPLFGIIAIVFVPNKVKHTKKVIFKKQKGLTGKTFSSTVGGVTFKSPSGKDRQSYIRNKLSISEPLFFRHEPNNKYDPDFEC